MQKYYLDSDHDLYFEFIGKQTGIYFTVITYNDYAEEDYYSIFQIDEIARLINKYI